MSCSAKDDLPERVPPSTSVIGPVIAPVVAPVVALVVAPCGSVTGGSGVSRRASEDPDPGVPDPEPAEYNADHGPERGLTAKTREAEAPDELRAHIDVIGVGGHDDERDADGEHPRRDHRG